jgi:adenosine deaminase
LSDQTILSLADQLKCLPKVDLHRHLEGSLRIETLWAIAQAFQLNLPPTSIRATTMEQLRPLVQVMADDLPDHETFLNKFEVLRHFYRSPEIISRVAYEAVADAAADNVQYLELRFSPQALSRVRKFPLGEVTDWVITAVAQASEACQIQVGLIITLVRHDPITQAREVLEVAMERAGKGIVGIDLAGNEVKYPSAPFAPLFKEAKESGLGVTIHAGEWASAYGVHDAMDALFADRIGHGVRTMEHSDILRLLQEKNLPLEVCLTSNVQTGVVHELAHHPLVDMLDLGLTPTLNTDDPAISHITLSTEYHLAMSVLGLPYAQIRKMILDAAAAVFLPPTDRQKLVADFDQQLPQTLADCGPMMNPIVLPTL